jgi:hypothetical protein
VSELEEILFRFTGIEKTTSYRLEMLNANFNMYTDKVKKNRPKVVRFKSFLRMMYDRGLNTSYEMTRMPWLKAQGAPMVVKGIYKPKAGVALPTVSISPYGHVELLGVKSFQDMLTAYRLVVDTFYDTSIAQDIGLESPSNTEDNEPRDGVTAKRRYKKKQPAYVNASIISGDKISIEKKNGNHVFINGKRCDKWGKPYVIAIARSLSVSDRGTKQALCDHIANAV